MRNPAEHGYATIVSGNKEVKKKILDQKTKVRLFRYYGGVSLFIACAVFGIVGYTLTLNLENEHYTAVYNSQATQIQNLVMSNLENKFNAAQSLATFFGIFCRKSQQWPDCNMPTHWFNEFTSSVNTISEVKYIGIIPIVQQNAAAEFEAGASNFLSKDPLMRNTSAGNLGIWSYDDAGLPYHDTTGYTPLSEYNFLTPLYLFSGMESLPNLVMLNTHTIDSITPMIDSAYECAIKNGTGCSTITDMSLNGYFVPDSSTFQPSALLFTPIYPHNNRSSIVGFSCVDFMLDSLFDNNTVLNSGSFDCVLSSGTTTVTYTLAKAATVVKGIGDVHDRKFGKYRKTISLTSAFSLQTLPESSYKLSIYPTRDFYNHYHRSTPVAIAIGAIGIMIFTTLLFALYAWLVRDERLEVKLIMENKRKFVRFISHQIRTPMHAVYMCLECIDMEFEKFKDMSSNSTGSTKEMMSKEELDELSICIDDVRESSEAAIVVLNDLLKYDEVGEQTVKCELKVIPIWDVILRTIRPMQVQAKQKSIKLHIYLEKDLEILTPQYRSSVEGLAAYADSQKIAFVLRNVVSNALKFTAHGSTVAASAIWHRHGDALSTYEVDPKFLKHHINYGYVRISVKDNGPGLTELQLADLFKEGKQFDASTLQNGNGSGLGLWISRMIVDQHFGRIFCESQGRGFGCTFHVDIPVLVKRRSHFHHTIEMQASGSSISEENVDLSLNDVSIPPRIFSESTNTDSSHSSKPTDVQNILLVDDVLSNRKFMRRMLERDGFTCYEAEDGVKCIEFIENGANPPIQLILLDFEMPNMTGPQAVKKLREKKYKTIVIGVTGNVLQADVEYFKESGANDVLAKPLKKEAIYKSYADIVHQQDIVTQYSRESFSAVI